MSWLICDLNSLINDESQKRLTIVLAIIAFQAEELNPQNINSDLLNKLLKLTNCDFNSNCLTVTLKELKRTYLEEKIVFFPSKCLLWGRFFRKLCYRNIQNLSVCVMSRYENDACVIHCQQIFLENIESLSISNEHMDFI